MQETEAVAEAHLCLQCGGPTAPAPCTIACPAGIDIPGFIHDIASGTPIAAARKIFTANVLGGSCARVCPVEVLCQGSCVLMKEGRQAIQIGRLQRFAADRALDDDADLLGPPPAWTLGHSVAVVGAGPAGLACAAELARRGHPVTVYEQRQRPGGLVVHGIAPYKQRTEPLPAEVQAIRRLGVSFVFGVRIGRDLSVDELRGRHEAVFLGIGMGDDLPANLPGEDSPGVWDSLAFIEVLKLGDPALLHIGPRVAVIGGGNTAIDVAREAAMLGAPEVMLLYRRSEAHMPAYRHEIDAARREGVKIIPLVSPLELVGWERVRGVRCIRMRLGAPDSSGRPRPEPIPGSEFVIEADTVIKAIGQRPRSELLALFGIEAPKGVVSVTREYQTSQPGVFAGGDCLSGGATVVEAVRDGRRAALAIDRYLTGQPRARRPARPATRTVQDNGTLQHLQGDYRLNTAPALCKGCNVCVTSCPVGTLSLNAAERITVNDVAACVFCGLCEARCPDFAIWMARGAMERALPPLDTPEPAADPPAPTPAAPHAPEVPA